MARREDAAARGDFPPPAFDEKAGPAFQYKPPLVFLHMKMWRWPTAGRSRVGEHCVLAASMFAAEMHANFITVGVDDFRGAGGDDGRRDIRLHTTKLSRPSRMAIRNSDGQLTARKTFVQAPPTLSHLPVAVSACATALPARRHARLLGWLFRRMVCRAVAGQSEVLLLESCALRPGPR